MLDEKISIEVLAQIIQRAKVTLSFSVLPTSLVLGLIEQESFFYTWAYRYEPSFYRRYLQNLNRGELSGVVPSEVSLQSEKTGRAWSWGLMQIMGETARVEGFEGDSFGQLFDPNINILFGVKHLRTCWEAYRYVPESERVGYAIMAYNGGKRLPEKFSKRHFEYRDSVLSRAKRFEA